MIAGSSDFTISAGLVLFGALLTLGVQYLTDRLRENRHEHVERRRRRDVECEAAFPEMAEAISFPLEVLENAASDYRRGSTPHESWWGKAHNPLNEFIDRWGRRWRFLFAGDATTMQHVTNVKVLLGSFASRIPGDSVGREDVEGFGRGSERNLWQRAGPVQLEAL